MIHYKVKNMEPFKDGNVLEGRFLKPGEVLIVSELDKGKLERSGAILEVIDTLVPNPLKVPEKPVEVAVVNQNLGDVPPEPVKRKAGRPRKNG